MPTLIGESTTNAIDIHSDQFAAPGVPSQLIVAAQFSDERYAGKDRFGDVSHRSFEVKARLSKRPKDQNDMRADVEPEHGSSFFLLAPGSSLEVQFGPARLELRSNTKNELSMVSSTINGTRALDARLIFESTLAALLDHLSYKHSAPVFIPLVTIRDVANEVQYIYFQTPPRATLVASHEGQVHSELRPIFALYRESQNAASPYYRVLCLYKILEGLLGSLQVALRKRAKAQSIDLQVLKAVVPDHANIAPWLKEQVGVPLNIFFEVFLAKQYRDAVAHFELSSKDPLNVSSPPESELFAHVAFLTDLCVHVAIERYVQWLNQLTSAQISGT